MPSSELNLTIRSTNGALWHEKFNSSEKVGVVLKRSVDHFIKEGSLQPGNYGLALVVHGKAQPPLDSGVKLSEAEVKDGALLVLVPLEPQKDG